MFSVVIPLYNKQDSIRQTLESVLQQSFLNFEVIVINDGSKDQSAEKVLEFNDNRIRLINKENGGPGSARNRGIAESKYSYIAFLDADDLWKPDYLLEQSKLINDFPVAFMWGCGWNTLLNSQEKGMNHGDIAPGFRGLVINYFDKKKKLLLYCSSSVVVSKIIFSKVGYFDEKIIIGEDHDLWFRIVADFPIVFYNIPLAIYNHDAENRLSKLQRPNLNICWPFFIDKYEPLKYTHPEYVTYIHTFFAGFLLPYYFGTKQERKLARQVTNKLDYKIIKMKYTLLYKTPYAVSLFVYILLKLKNIVRH